MIPQQLTTAIKHWSYIAPIVKYPKNHKEFNKLVNQLDELLNIVGDDEGHYLMGLIDTISHLVSSYEDEHSKPLKVKGIFALKFLMETHHLSQSDFSDIASQGVFSEILNGKRMLNLRQIKLLAKRFHVDPSTFIDD
ncbi:MAG: putative transcription regulator containing domain [Gammaproteobacteria bacterium]|jgi:HTH-type transcriptional regulator/antitoxin HigA|nr:putative transcription regulator containing domain [Gammaproteobacteria bacterium]